MKHTFKEDAPKNTGSPWLFLAPPNARRQPNAPEGDSNMMPDDTGPEEAKKGITQHQLAHFAQKKMKKE